MFLNYLKNLFVKNKLKNSDTSLWDSTGFHKIQKVGLIVDESNFDATSDLIKGLVTMGFSEEKIKIRVYQDRHNKKMHFPYPTFGPSTLRWNGTVLDENALDLIYSELDLLISYYDKEKPLLVLLTHQSKAHFKVGLSAVDTRLNHLMIATDLKEHTVFVSELKKYLKILNKIE